jgi:hypothetical protein
MAVFPDSPRDWDIVLDRGQSSQLGNALHLSLPEHFLKKRPRMDRGSVPVTNGQKHAVFQTGKSPGNRFSANEKEGRTEQSGGAGRRFASHQSPNEQSLHLDCQPNNETVSQH